MNGSSIKLLNLVISQLMIRIDYPKHEFRIQKREGNEIIFDELRKRWVALTPEEWVRQNFLQYMILQKQYPRSLIAVEKLILLGDLKKRFDILLYNMQQQPWMIVECKAMSVELSEGVLNQVLRYNIAVPASFLVITNGNDTFAWARQGSGMLELSELPEWGVGV